MKILTPFCLALLLALLTPFPGAADEMISIRGGYQLLNVGGHFAGEDNGSGTNIDIDEDIDFDDSNSWTAEGAIQFGNFRLSAGYLPMDFSGKSTLSDAISFNGIIFPANNKVKGDIDLDFYDVGLTLYLINFDDLPVRVQLGPEVAAKIANVDIRLKDETTGISQDVSGVGGLPTIGARGRVGLADYLGVVGRIGYMAYSGNSVTDAEIQVEFSPIPLLGIYGGYRYIDINVDESDVEIDVQLQGPYVGAFARF